MSATPLGLRRYELFGWDYESHSPLREAELAWYVSHAHEAAGPILELACGTGRLLLALAIRGFRVVGLELCPGMLKLARQRIAVAPDRIRERVELRQGDMTSFRLGTRFGLAILADNSFRELSTADEQQACLRCVHEHIAPGGQLLLTVRRFDPASSNRDIPWSDWVRHPETGDLVQRRISIRVTSDGRSIEGVMYYRTRRADGTQAVDECPFAAPVMSTADYLALLSGAGFSTRVCSGYVATEDDGTDPVLCFVAEKPAGSR